MKGYITLTSLNDFAICPNGILHININLINVIQDEIIGGKFLHGRIMVMGHFYAVKESYEEIKELIKQAQ